MKRKQFIILVLLLIIGFASVSATLVLNGNIGVGVKLDDFDVIFIEALLDRKEDTKATIGSEKKTITFSTDKISNVGDTARLDYKVKNTSTQYDADVTINCTNENSEYVTVTSEFDGNSLPLENLVNIKAQEVKSGYINAELTKAYPGDDTSIEIVCSIVFTATSRDTVEEEKEYIVTLDSGYEEQLGDIKVKYYEEYSKLPELTRTNYKFLGWYTEDDIKVDNNSLAKIKGDHTLKAKWLFVCPYESGKVWEFNYTGGEQEFTVPCDGNYKLETWGGQGGTASSTYAIGGYGASAYGTIKFSKDKKIYINVGGAGRSNNNSTTVGVSGGYNGGGSCGYTNWPTTGIGNAYLASGGGATHISDKSGLLKSLSDSKEQILIVAGGGGAGFFHDNYSMRSYGNGGHAGGVRGNNGQINNSVYAYGLGGTQTSGGGSSSSISANKSGFGYGSYVATNQMLAISAGGGGWYGGGASSAAGAGGGSSYVGNPLLTNKVMYCYNCTQSSEESTKTISTTCTSSTPTANCAKQGNGYAKITLVSVDS